MSEDNNREKPYIKREPLNGEIHCPYDNITYNHVPGYVEGYGCPVCKAIGTYHLPVSTLPFISDWKSIK